MRKGMQLAGLVLAVGFSGAAAAAQAVSFSDLVSTLSTKRDACAEIAQKAQSDFSTAAFNDSLTAQTDAQKSRIDAQVYAVGHGNRETTQFLIARMQQDATTQADRAKANSDRLAAARTAVQQCVSDAEAAGKAAFASFKADQKHKSAVSEAEQATTAWLVNLQEITTDHPQGGDTSKENWAAAKARASLQ